MANNCQHNQLEMEALGRFELPTCGLGNRRSIHLSYRATHPHYIFARGFVLTLIVVAPSSRRSAHASANYGVARFARPVQLRADTRVTV